MRDDERDVDLGRRQNLGGLLGVLGGAVALRDGRGGAGDGGLWPYDKAIPADVAAPGLRQEQSTTGAGATVHTTSQAAKSGSGCSGGDMSFILGADDGSPGNPRMIWFGLETVVGGVQPFTNYLGIAILKWLPGQVANLVLGAGHDGVGGGCAGVEIGSFGELSIAVENDGPINNIVAGTGQTSTYLYRTAHDATDEAAWTLTYVGNHATSGDISGVQINYSRTAIGTGVERYLDIRNAGTRQFSIQPYSLGGAQLTAETGYLWLNGPHIAASTADFEVLYAGVYGLKIDASAAALSFDTGELNTSWELRVATVPAIELTGNKLATLQGRNRHTRSVAADTTVAQTDDILLFSVTGKTATLPASPANGDMYTVMCTAPTAAVTTLDGNGANILLAAVSAPTHATANGVALTVVFDAASGLWLANPGY